jgi:hypothetical protein
MTPCPVASLSPLQDESIPPLDSQYASADRWNINPLLMHSQQDGLSRTWRGLTATISPECNLSRRHKAHSKILFQIHSCQVAYLNQLLRALEIIQMVYYINVDWSPAHSYLHSRVWRRESIYLCSLKIWFRQLMYDLALFYPSAHDVMGSLNHSGAAIC